MSDVSGLKKASAVGALGVAALGAAIMISKYLSSQKQAQSDDAPGRTLRNLQGSYSVTGKTVMIDRPRSELFAFWRDFENLPQFMENIESVSPSGPDGQSVWKIKAPMGRSIEIETEIAREVEGELIAWRSVAGSDVSTQGRVAFRDAPANRGTLIEAIIAYEPPGGTLGEMIAKAFQRDPETQARHDLKRLKMLMETGEIATSASQKNKTRAAQQSEEN